jgi:signal transduction histidine kinase
MDTSAVALHIFGRSRFAVGALLDALLGGPAMKPDAKRNSGHLRVATARRFVASAFGLVAIGVIISMLFALAETRELQERTRGIVSSMMGSTHVLGRVDRLIERRRILVDDHIFDKDVGVALRLEAEIGKVDRELSVAMHEFEPWANLPGEREIWDRVRETLASIDEPQAQAIALSRVNRDIEAKAIMDGVAGRFEAINRDLDELDAINDEGASTLLARLEGVRERLQFVLLAIGAVALGATALVGMWAAQQVARREEQLAFEARALEARNRELDAFAGRVAHDIRSPLASMKLALGSLGRSQTPSDARAIQVLDRSAGRMEALVEDLLALALSEGAGHGRCDPAAVARRVEEDFRPRVDAARGNLRLEVASADVGCSEGLLHQAVTNLVENAVKYRRPDAPPDVELAGAPVDGGYDFRVTDNGQGMSPEEAEHAFEPFYRSPAARDLPGTGLGLSIVKRVAEVAGGSMSVETKPGQGSTFVMHLPLASRRHGGAGAR